MVTAAATDAPIANKVLVIVYDPILESMGGKRLHAAYGWEDPLVLTDGVVADLEAASHGVVDYQIVETILLDEYPWHVGGFRYTDATWISDWAAHTPNKAAFDWQRLIDDHDVVARIANGSIDEVWIYQDPLDQDSAWESTMAGDGAYWLNSPPVEGDNGARAFVLMSWNYERGVAEALHSYGHRTENNLCRAFGTPPGNACVDPDQGNDWGRFVAIERNAPGKGGIGTIHFPVNGTSDYDYADTRLVLSNVDAWDSYPDLSAPPRLVNVTEWSPAGQDPHRDYLRWWFGHLPHVAGTNADGRLDNWWRYIVEVDAFKNGGVVIPPTPSTLSSSFKTGSTVVSGSLPVRFTWTGRVGSSPIDHYDVETRVDGGTWSDPVSQPGTGITVNCPVPRHSCQVRVRTIDTAGRHSPWATSPAARPVAYQQTSSKIRYKGTWRTATSGSFSGGTARKATRKAASATFTFTGRSVAWVGLKCSTCGSVRVYVNGTYLTTLSTYAASSAYTRFTWTKTWSSSKTRTVRLVVKETPGHPRVYVDLFARLK